MQKSAITDREANDEIDKYLQEQSYKSWAELDPEDRDKVLQQMYEDEELYNKYTRNDWHE